MNRWYYGEQEQGDGFSIEFHLHLSDYVHERKTHCCFFLALYLTLYQKINVVWALSSLCDTWYCSLSACVCYWPFCRQHHSFIASICQLQLLKIWLWTQISHLLCLFLSLSRSSTLPFNSSFISNFCLLSPSFFLTCFPGHFLLLFFPPPSCRKSR